MAVTGNYDCKQAPSCNTFFPTLQELFLLVTDQGYLKESNVVWETLSSIDGDGHLENVLTSADAYVTKILSRVNPEVRFKSSAQKKKVSGKETKTGFRDKLHHT